MTWQEDLRRIDSDLAAGKLSKEQYAVKREELLAQAATVDVPANVPGKVPSKAAPPVPAKELLTTTRQTTAPSPADERSTDSMPHPKRPPNSAPVAVKEPIKRTEVPPPVPPVRPQPPRTPPARPAVSAPAPQPAERPNGTVRTWLFLGLGLLLAVGLIAAGLWWMTSGDEGDREAGGPPPTSEPSEPTTTAPPELVDQLPELPGVVNRNSGTFGPDEGAERKLYGDDEALLLKANDVREVTWKGSSRELGDAEMSYVILVAENENAKDAARTARALRGLSQSRVPRTPAPEPYEQLPTFKKVSKAGNVYRVIYTSDNRTVRVGVTQSPGVDEQRLVDELTDLLARVTAELPPDEK